MFSAKIKQNMFLFKPYKFQKSTTPYNAGTVT